MITKAVRKKTMPKFISLLLMVHAVIRVALDRPTLPPSPRAFNAEIKDRQTFSGKCRGIPVGWWLTSATVAAQPVRFGLLWQRVAIAKLARQCDRFLYSLNIKCPIQSCHVPCIYYLYYYMCSGAAEAFAMVGVEQTKSWSLQWPHEN